MVAWKEHDDAAGCDLSDSSIGRVRGSSSTAEHEPVGKVALKVMSRMQVQRDTVVGLERACSQGLDK